MTKKSVLTGRRAFLIGSGALIGVGTSVAAGKFRQQSSSAQVIDGAERSFEVTGSASLRERAAAKGLIYGAAETYNRLSSNSTLATRVTQECSMVVSGSEFLWRNVHPRPDSFNFTRGDGLVEFTRTRGMLLLGTHLVWHKALPRWVKETVNRQNAEQVLRNHIKNVVGHYAGNVNAWTVVNEAVYPTSKRSDGLLQQTPWFEYLGPNYIDIAFRAAAEADPQALLIYNENQIEYDSSGYDQSRADLLKLLERLKSNGVPVQALGVQSHLGTASREDEPRSKFTKLREFLRDVADLGLKILITEMDVADKISSTDLAVRDRAVAAVYEDYLSVVLDEPAVIAVATWGMSDASTWLASQKWSKRADSSPVRPLPFDAKLQPKLAYNAIARAFENAPVREAWIRLPNQQTALQDVQGHWAQAYIQALAAKNIISGYPDGTFRPSSPVTRAEFAAIVNKAFSSAQQSNSTIGFRDVPQSYWAYNAIQTAVRNGFLAGYPGGVFQPNQQIPRAQVLVSLAGGLKLGGANPSVLSFYQDADQIPTYATSQVAAATQQKLVVNYPTVKVLSPNRASTRAEVAAFVYQALVSDGKAKPIASPYVAVPNS